LYINQRHRGAVRELVLPLPRLFIAMTRIFAGGWLTGVWHERYLVVSDCQPFSIAL
jgi:hypothetical protein